jgi:hypothetical protein
VSPADFSATLFHCLGLPSDATVPDRLGRPVAISEGRAIHGLLEGT